MSKTGFQKLTLKQLQALADCVSLADELKRWGALTLTKSISFKFVPQAKRTFLIILDEVNRQQKPRSKR